MKLGRLPERSQIVLVESEHSGLDWIRGFIGLEFEELELFAHFRIFLHFCFLLWGWGFVEFVCG